MPAEWGLLPRMLLELLSVHEDNDSLHASVQASLLTRTISRRSQKLQTQLLEFIVHLLLL